MYFNFKYLIYCDGSCPVPGGYWGYGGVILENRSSDNDTLEWVEIDQVSGGGIEGTNNIGELNAAIQSISKIPHNEKVLIRSDSQYVCNAFNLGWIEDWKSRGWKRKHGPLKNVDLWKILYRECSDRRAVFEWVKGHAGNYYNEMSDRLAEKGRLSIELINDYR